MARRLQDGSARVGPRRWLTIVTLMLMLPSATAAFGGVSISPTRIALGPAGRLIVSDYRHQRVVLLDREQLGPVASLGIPGRPLGVALRGVHLLVGNESTAGVEIYRIGAEGIGQREGSLGFGEGFFPEPRDIAVDEASGLVFVVSGGKQAVIVVDLARREHTQISGPGPDPENLVQPTGIALDGAAQEVFVSDFGDPANGIPARIQVFGFDGTHLGSISGDSGQDGFEFSRPQGLAVGAGGDLYVVDSLLGQVLVFDRATLRGQRILGDYGSGPGELMLPLDVALDPLSGDVFVTDNRNARVEAFAGAGGSR